MANTRIWNLSSSPHADAIEPPTAPIERHATAKPGVKISMMKKISATMIQMCQGSIIM